MPNKKYRDIVLVGHGLSNDMSMLTEFQVDVQDILPIVDIVDTLAIGRAVYDRGLKLENLLEVLGCPYAKLHNAGNDATFTLKAFLALAIKTQWAGPQHWLSQFRKVAFAPVKATEILSERLAQEIAYGRANHKQAGQDEEKDWAETLENRLFWEIV